MNNNIFLHLPGNSHNLVEHFGNEDTTIIMGDAYISREPTSSRPRACSTQTCSSHSTYTQRPALTATATSLKSRASPRTS